MYLHFFAAISNGLKNPAWGSVIQTLLILQYFKII